MHRTSKFVLAVFLALAFVSTSLVADQADWPQWRGMNRDDLSSESGLLQSWPEEGPPRAWLFENCGLGYAGPAVVGDRLYILGTRDGQEQLFCLNATSGNEVWSTPIGQIYENSWGDGPRSTPTVVDDLVYAMGAQGNLVCVHRGDGSVVWKKSMQDLSGEIPTWGYAESPLVWNELVFCTPGGTNGTIAALDRMTGKKVWQTSELTDLAHYSSIVLMDHSTGKIGVQLLEKQVVGFRIDDGKLLWSSPWPGSVAVIPTPIVRGNQVYITSGYGAGCQLLSVADDYSVTSEYDNKVMGNHHGGVVLLGDHLYGHSDKKGWTCQDFATGKKVWQERQVLGKGAIAYADNHFFCLSEDEGEVVLIAATPEAWKEQGRFTLSPQTELRKPRGKIWVHPVIADGRLYLRDQEYVYCYDVRAK